MSAAAASTPRKGFGAVAGFASRFLTGDRVAAAEATGAYVALQKSIRDKFAKFGVTIQGAVGAPALEALAEGARAKSRSEEDTLIQNRIGFDPKKLRDAAPYVAMAAGAALVLWLALRK